MRKVWNERRTMNRNLFEMGIVGDVNKGIQSAKQQRLEMVKKTYGLWEEDEAKKPEKIRPKKYVVENMETSANALRESEFRYNYFNFKMDHRVNKDFFLDFLKVLLHLPFI